MDNEHENEDELDLKDKVEGEEGDDPPVEGDDPPVDNDADTPEEIAFAKRLGWVSEADWDPARAEKAGIRKPAHFKSARQWIADTSDDRALLNERLRKQDKTIVQMGEQLKDVHEVVLSQKKATAEAVKRARQQGIDEAEARMRDAATAGELGDYDKAKEDRDKLVNTPVPEESKPRQREEQEEEEDEPKTKPHDPEMLRWVAANPWINENLDRYNAMVLEETILKKKNPGIGVYEVLDKAATNVKRRFPELFGLNPRRDAPSTVSPPSGARQGRTGFDAIPQSDKDEFEKQRKMFAKMKGPDGKPIVYTKEEFMQEYGHT